MIDMILSTASKLRDRPAARVLHSSRGSKASDSVTPLVPWSTVVGAATRQCSTSEDHFLAHGNQSKNQHPPVWHGVGPPVSQNKIKRGPIRHFRQHLNGPAIRYSSRQLSKSTPTPSRIASTHVKPIRTCRIKYKKDAKIKMTIASAPPPTTTTTRESGNTTPRTLHQRWWLQT